MICYSDDLTFTSNFINSFICGDNIEVMRKMPDGCVDLIITSPPYNLKNSTGGGNSSNSGKWKNSTLLNTGYDSYGDNMRYDKYIQWQQNCLSEMMRLIPENGAIFYNHKWRVQAGLLQDRHEIVRGFPVRQIIIWKRSGGINFNRGYFLPTYEVIYLIAKPKFVLADKGNRHGDVWTIDQERNNKHPAPFPVKLSDTIVSATDANVILDPFMGSGTVAISAKKYNRKFIGIDKSEAYCKDAEDRLLEQFSNPFQRR